MTDDRCPDCRAMRWTEVHLTRTCGLCGRAEVACAGCCGWVAAGHVTRTEDGAFCLSCMLAGDRWETDAAGGSGETGAGRSDGREAPRSPKHRED